MKLFEQKVEKGRLVTRLCGVRVWRSAREPDLSEQAQLLRRELLMMADVAKIPPARGFARDVQLVGVALLKEILRVARENGFNPWLIRGCLIGTVRHAGHFVPWDDDVDVGMLRDEYDRFCEVFNDRCREGFYAWRRFSRKWNQIKVSHRDLPKDVTSSVMSYDLYHSSLPTLKEKHALFMKVRDAQERNAARFDPQADDAAHRAALDSARREWIMDGKDSAPPETKPAVLRGIEFMTPDWVKEAVYDYDDIFPLKPATFEGVDVMVPNDPETVLTYNYGDWAGWPGRLKPHHPASTFNMEKALALRKFLKAHGQGEGAA